jgi:hypothetical protein
MRAQHSGYVVGALLAGTSWAIGAVGALTLRSGCLVALVMRETHRGGRRRSIGVRDPYHQESQLDAIDHSA